MWPAIQDGASFIQTLSAREALAKSYCRSAKSHTSSTYWHNLPAKGKKLKPRASEAFQPSVFLSVDKQKTKEEGGQNRPSTLQAPILVLWKEIQMSSDKDPTGCHSQTSNWLWCASNHASRSSRIYISCSLWQLNPECTRVHSMYGNLPAGTGRSGTQTSEEQSSRRTVLSVWLSREPAPELLLASSCRSHGNSYRIW